MRECCCLVLNAALVDPLRCVLLCAVLNDSVRLLLFAPGAVLNDGVYCAVLCYAECCIVALTRLC